MLVPLRLFLRDFAGFAGAKGFTALLFVFLDALVKRAGLKNLNKTKVEFLLDSGHAVPSESGETMSRRPRRNYTLAFKARVVRSAIEGDRTLVEPKSYGGVAGVVGIRLA